MNLAPTTWAWVRRIAEIAPTVLWALAAAGAAIMIIYFPPGLLALVLEHMRRQVHRLHGQIRQLHHSGISSGSADALLDRMHGDPSTTVSAASVSSGRIECVKRAGRVDERSAGVDADSDAQRLGDFFLGGAELLCCRRMNGDTAVAAQADCHGKRDELARLCIQMSGFCAGTAERRVALHRIRRKLADLANAGENLFSVLVPIKHSHLILHGFGCCRYVEFRVRHSGANYFLLTDPGRLDRQACL